MTIVNKTGKRFDPGLFHASVQSGNEEGDLVIDSAKGVEGSPNTTLLKGREAKFKYAYGVADPSDIVLEAAPSFEHEDVVYATQ